MRHLEAGIEIDWEPGVYAALSASFVQWIHEPDVLRRLADSAVAMTFIAPQHDIRPSWPLRQLAALIPQGRFEGMPGVAHNLWSTDPQVWVDLVTRACTMPSTSATAP